MSKRKTMYKVEIAAELQKGQRVAVVERNYKDVGSTVRIGYVDSHSTDRTMVYVDFRWRGNREGSVFFAEDRCWDLIYLNSGHSEVYITDKSLKQMCASMVKAHPDWHWLKGVSNEFTI